MRAFDNYDRSSDDGSITLVPYLNVAPYNSMHESVCNFAPDQSAPLIIIPFHQNDETPVGGLVAGTIRKLNLNLLAHAKCTVGILMDRHCQLRVGYGLMSLHIGVFFVGGPDDREALALGMRMAGGENSSIVVFRFVVKKHEEERDDEWKKEYEEDRRMDESLIDEFRAMKFGRGKVEYHEINVEGSEEFDGLRKYWGQTYRRKA